MTKKEKPETMYRSFKEVDKIKIDLGKGNFLTIILKKNKARNFRIEYFLNKELIKPKNIKGSSLAFELWEKILKKKKEI